MSWVYATRKFVPLIPFTTASPHESTKQLLAAIDSTDKHTTRFKIGSASHPYTVIQPLTPLEELEEFFVKAKTDFALGKST